MIKGDNLDALKLLYSSYKEKIKLIYIDPPYNTKTKRLYKDNFTVSEKNGEFFSALEEFTKNDTHTGWLAFMMPRLLIARDLLREDGVIFISIDDNEQAQLKILMDAIFGADNFIAQVVWEKRYANQNTAKYVSVNHEYILVYKKSEALEELNGLPRSEKNNSTYTTNLDNDPRGLWQSIDFSCMGKSNKYDIINPAGKKCIPPAGRGWGCNEKKYKELLADNRIWFGKNGDTVPRLKRFLHEVRQYVVCPSIWQCRKDDANSVGHTDLFTRELQKLFNGEKVFDFPKGTKLIKHILQLGSSPKDDDIILDFFAGSGTTGHAVLEKNLEDKQAAIAAGEDPTLVGNRKYIMVQLDEKIDESKNSRFKTVFDICHERLQRAGNKINIEKGDITLDTEFEILDLTC